MIRVMKHICVVLKQWFSTFSAHHSHLEGFLQQMAGPHPQISDLLGLGWDLRICISNKFPGNAAAAPETEI